MTHDEIQRLRVGDCIITKKDSYKVIVGWRAKGVMKPFVGCQRGAGACEYVKVTPPNSVIPISEVKSKVDPKHIVLLYCERECGTCRRS